MRTTRSGHGPSPGRVRGAGRPATALAVVIAIAAVVAPAVAAQPAPPPRPPLLPLPTARLTVLDAPLTVELATEPAAKARGLAHRAGLAPGTGMLFVDRVAAPRTHWMKGMRFCVDIVWIQVGEVGAAAVRGAQIAGAAESVCPDAPGTPDEARVRHSSSVPVRYVLEAPAGWLKANDLGVGAPVRIPDEVWTP